MILGQQYHIGVRGNLGIAAMFSNTALEALDPDDAVSELHPDLFQYELTVNGDMACMKAKELIDLHDLRRMICEKEFASIYRMRDVISKPLELHEVHLAYP